MSSAARRFGRELRVHALHSPLGRRLRRLQARVQRLRRLGDRAPCASSAGLHAGCRTASGARSAGVGAGRPLGLAATLRLRLLGWGRSPRPSGPPCDASGVALRRRPGCRSSRVRCGRSKLRTAISPLSLISRFASAILVHRGAEELGLHPRTSSRLRQRRKSCCVSMSWRIRSATKSAISCCTRLDALEHRLPGGLDGFDRLLLAGGHRSIRRPAAIRFAFGRTPDIGIGRPRGLFSDMRSSPGMSANLGCTDLTRPAAVALSTPGSTNTRSAIGGRAVAPCRPAER